MKKFRLLTLEKTVEESFDTETEAYRKLVANAYNSLLNNEYLEFQGYNKRFALDRLKEMEVKGTAEDIKKLLQDYPILNYHEQEVVEVETSQIMEEGDKIQQAFQTLYNEGFQVTNLWKTKDVTDKYECSEQEAMKVLEKALTNEATMEQIWLAIDFEAENLKLK